MTSRMFGVHDVYVGIDNNVIICMHCYEVIDDLQVRCQFTLLVRSGWTGQTYACIKGRPCWLFCKKIEKTHLCPSVICSFCTPLEKPVKSWGCSLRPDSETSAISAIFGDTLPLLIFSFPFNHGSAVTCRKNGSFSSPCPFDYCLNVSLRHDTIISQYALALTFHVRQRLSNRNW